MLDFFLPSKLKHVIRSGGNGHYSAQKTRDLFWCHPRMIRCTINFTHIHTPCQECDFGVSKMEWYSLSKTLLLCYYGDLSMSTLKKGSGFVANSTFRTKTISLLLKMYSVFQRFCTGRNDFNFFSIHRFVERLNVADRSH
jgi:hypothetical protein